MRLLLFVVVALVVALVAAIAIALFAIAVAVAIAAVAVAVAEEGTSTSPSGRHLGHYKLLVKMLDDSNADKISILRYLKDEEDTICRCKLSSMDTLENTGKHE